MRMKGRMLAALLVLGTASGALAVTKGGTLYVKAKNTRLMASSAKDAKALAVLQPGQTVTWLGADPKAKQWHQVEAGGKKGVVFQSNLATKAPNMELVASKGTLTQKDAAEFANSAAAVKLLSDGAIAYGTKEGGAMERAVPQLQQLEKLAERVDAAKLAAHAKAAGLFPVVGASGDKAKVAGGGGP
jgi:hypothetical protein